MNMFGREKTLFRLFGLPIKANLSWLFLVALVVASLAQGYFPGELGESASWQLCWGLALLGAVALFASLIAHEMCHSLVARSTGTPVAGITLFIFGGVSQLEDEPPTAGAEFIMAVVGPLASLVIGSMFLVVWIVGQNSGMPAPALALIKYLWFINFLLAAFNSLPAFPLDGGRVLRSVLWGITDDLRIATRVAAHIGAFFGLALTFLGLLALLAGGARWIIPGIWFMVIGFFLRQAAMGHMQMVVMRQHLRGDKVRRFMTTDVVTVPPELSLQQFVDEYIFHHRFSYYPVVDSVGRFTGLVSARSPRTVDRARWAETTVADVMDGADKTPILGPETEAVDALSALRLGDQHRAVIVQDGRPVGILSLRDLLGFLALKIDLEPRR